MWYLLTDYEVPSDRPFGALRPFGSFQPIGSLFNHSAVSDHAALIVSLRWRVSGRLLPITRVPIVAVYSISARYQLPTSKRINKRSSSFAGMTKKTSPSKYNLALSLPISMRTPPMKSALD